MADSIRGLTVKISADATEFKKEINAVRKDSKSAQAELTALQKSLQLEFDGEKFARAQKVAQEAIDKTAQEAEMLRTRLKQLEESGNVDTSEYRKVQTELAQAETKAQQLQEKLKELNNLKFDKLANNVKSVGDKIQGVGKALTPVSVAAAGAITGIAALGVKTASTGAELDDLSQRLGISAEKVQELKYVAAQAGVDWEVYNKGIIKARAALLDLSSGISNNATKAVQSLGISLESFSSQEEMIDGVMTALAGVKDKTLQAAYANEIFGDKIANEMLPYLNAGAEEIQKFKSEFEGMSYLTNEQVKSLATLDDTIYLLKQSLSNVVLQIGASLSPLIQSLTEYVNANVIPMLQRLADWFNNLTVGQQELVIKLLLVTAALAPLATGVGKIVSLVGSIIKILPQLGAAFSALEAHPIVLIIAAIAAVLLILYTQCEAFRESINNLTLERQTYWFEIIEDSFIFGKSELDPVFPMSFPFGFSGALFNSEHKARNDFFSPAPLNITISGNIFYGLNIYIKSLEGEIISQIDFQSEPAAGAVVTINATKKKITVSQNGVSTNGYDLTDKTKQSFLYLPQGEYYIGANISASTTGKIEVSIRRYLYD